jgi:4-carboxymuconolactone decarboxylase
MEAANVKGTPNRCSVLGIFLPKPFYSNSEVNNPLEKHLDKREVKCYIEMDRETCSIADAYSFGNPFRATKPIHLEKEETVMPRIPLMTKGDELSDAQKKAYDAIAATPRGGVRGPFALLLHSPVVAERTSSLGEYIRFDSRISLPIRIVAALVTARIMNCQFEFTANADHAKKAGVGDTVVAAIRDRRAPEGLNEEEALVFQLGTELLTGKYRISPKTFGSAMKRYGVQGLVDLVSTFGYYSHLACVLNAFEMEPRPDHQPLPL